MSRDFKLKGSMSITRPNGGGWDGQISIVIVDENSRARFLDIKIEAEDMMLALTGRSDVPMSFETRSLGKVGKHVIRKTIQFEIPKDIEYSKRQDVAYAAAKKEVEGTIWIAGEYFGSKNSFFTKSGKEYASCQCNAYLSDEEYEAFKAGKFATDGEE